MGGRMDHRHQDSRPWFLLIPHKEFSTPCPASLFALPEYKAKSEAELWESSVSLYHAKTVSETEGHDNLTPMVSSASLVCCCQSHRCR
ncbi:hypothetical protein NC651_038125 [Populus alba x Populus x berolinensis]|nr:hypothetical protein NC651_038125 [Populus alba x Populus x berolinensis]